MGRSCQFHQLLALQPQGVDHHQSTYWQVWMLLLPMLHCPMSANSIASQLMKMGAHKNGSHAPTRSCPIYERSQHLRETVSLALLARGVFCCPQVTVSTKITRSGFYFPGVCTPRWVSSQILVLQLPHVLHAPTQNFKDLEKSTNSHNPEARKATGGPKELSPLYLCCASPSKSLRDSAMLVSNQSLTHCSHRNRRVFNQGEQS